MDYYRFSNPYVGEIDIGLDIEPEIGAADSGDLEVDLPSLLVAVAEAAQERGYQAWNHAASSPITLAVVREAGEQVSRRLDENFFRVRFRPAYSTRKNVPQGHGRVRRRTIQDW